MISIDQVLLLQQKVESAVQKIVQLKAENDALRSKCSELTNALSEKTELLASFTADEKKIEDSILGALDRLNKIENSVLSQAGQNTASTTEAAPLSKPNPTEKSNTSNVETSPAPAAEPQQVQAQPQKQPPVESEEIVAPEFDMDEPVADDAQDSDDKEAKFDIF